MRVLNLNGATCPSTATLREAVARINACPHLFQIVLDGEGRVCGVLTDGDVRRALLRDISLDASVTSAMNASPRLGRYADTEENLRQIAKLEERTGFLPVVDDAGVLQQILLAAPGELQVSTALIMAGGRGSRLGDRTRNTPKPLLPIGQRPILDRIMSSLEDAGISRILISVHYLADRIESFIASRNNTVKVEILHEDVPLGTAGALSLLPSDVSNDIVVLNGDVVTRVDYQALFTFHKSHGYDATLGVAVRDFEIPFGVIQYDEDGRFRGVREKPVVRHFVNSGIYLLGPRVYRLLPRGQRRDMPDLLNQAHGLGIPVGVFPVHEYWQDVGRPADLESADRLLSEGTDEVGS